MILDSQKRLPLKPTTPNILKTKIHYFTNCNMTTKEIILFNQALQCVAKQLIMDGIDLSDYYVLNVFFTEDGSISFRENNDATNGSQLYMAIYRMNKLRKFNSSILMLFVFIEELTHYFWRIYDETDVKYKIVEIINHIVPDLTIDIVKGWGLNGL